MYNIRDNFNTGGRMSTRTKIKLLDDVTLRNVLDDL